ncbi:MAG TPA: hypothetical protein VE860_11205 [Chthoniobacterales bacterium]|nr:hypothetical protein [Chthoniobacterales bacterium]
MHVLEVAHTGSGPELGAQGRALACIAHPPRRMNDAGSNSGIVRLRRNIPLLFVEENLKAVCFHPLFQNRLMNRRQRLFMSPQ